MALRISDSYFHCDEMSFPFEYIDRYSYYFGSYFVDLKKITPPTHAIHCDQDWSTEIHQLLIDLVKVHKLCRSFAKLKEILSPLSDDDPDIVLVKNMVTLIDSKFNQFIKSTEKDKQSLFLKKIWEYQGVIDDCIRVTKNDRCWSVAHLKRQIDPSSSFLTR